MTGEAEFPAYRLNGEKVSDSAVVQVLQCARTQALQSTGPLGLFQDFQDTGLTFASQPSFSFIPQRSSQRSGARQSVRAPDSGALLRVGSYPTGTTGEHPLAGLHGSRAAVAWASGV